MVYWEYITFHGTPKHTEQNNNQKEIRKEKKIGKCKVSDYDSWSSCYSEELLNVFLWGMLFISVIALKILEKKFFFII